MKAKLKQDYRHSFNGVDIVTIQKGEIIEGELAEKLIASGVAEKVTARKRKASE